MSGHLHYFDYFRCLLPATLGNITGGVAIVTLLNYGQVRLGEGDEGS